MNFSGNGIFGLGVLRAAALVVCLLGALVFPGPAGVGFAAIAVTAVINKTNYKSWTVTALDADTTLAFAHGFTQTAPTGNPATSVAPDMVTITPTSSVLSLAGAYAVAVSSTQISIFKTNAAGSGGAVPGTTIVAKIVAWRPHSAAE